MIVKYHVFLQDEKDENKMIHHVVEGFEKVEKMMKKDSFVGFVNEFQFKNKKGVMIKC
jgi:hypothetical protein